MCVKYCKTCKALFPASAERCIHCGKKLYPISDPNEPVRLCVIGGTERALLRGLLDDAGIPYLESNVQPQGVANEIVTGYDVKLSNVSMLVPFSALPKASELLASLETAHSEVEEHLPAIQDEIVTLRELHSGEDKPMSPALRTTVKVLSALAFLILVAVAVLGTDKLMELLKGLFGG